MTSHPVPRRSRDGRWARLAAACAWILSSGCASDPAPQAPPLPGRPNIVLVSLDTVRWDHTTLAGYHRPTTPALAELAALPGSTTFERAYAGAAWSLPSYASLFTGLDAMGHGVGFLRTELDPAHATLAEALSAYGYRTAAFTSGPHLHPSTGLNRGFATYDHLDNLGPMAPMVDGALSWIDQRPPEPFFLFLVGYDAHSPYAAPSAFAELFDPDYDGFLHYATSDVPDDPCERRGATRTCLRVFPGRMRGGGIDPADQAHTAAHYDAAVRAADYGLGRLLDGLEQRGLLEDSLLVVLADHGESLGEEKGRFHHDDQVGDAVFHVPLVIRLPGGQAPAARSDALISLVDLSPTLLELLQMQPPASAKGHSFLAELGLPSAHEPGHDAVIGASLCCYWARDRDWELRGRDRSQGQAMAWSLHRDGQGPDLASEQPAILGSLQGRLAHWPPHPGGTEGLPGSLPEDQQEVLRQALKEGGYWSPDEPRPHRKGGP